MTRWTLDLSVSGSRSLALGTAPGLSVPTVAPAHHQVTDVHYHRILQRRHIDKFTRFIGILDLEDVSL